MTVMTVDFQKTLAMLSSMYLCKPTKDVIEGWRTALADSAPDLLLGLKAALDGIDTESEQELEDVLWEYTCLFIGPYKLPCPPWESVYTSPKGLMMQSAHDEVTEAYRNEGVTVNSSEVMADHISMELNFLTLLLLRMVEEPERRQHYVGSATRFIREHLQKWVPAFTRDLSQAADFTFYKELARTTGETIAVIQSEILAASLSDGV